MSNMLPEYSTVRFCDVYNNAAAFVSDYKASALYDAYIDTAQVLHLNNSLSDANATKLFYLLYARYGNNPIANWDEEQFKYKLFSVIFQYGPTWAKKLDIQVKVRELKDDEEGKGIFAGSRTIYNAAANPSTEPSTQSLEELTYINAQNTTNYKRSPLEGYTMLLDLLETDVTEDFLKRFNICFKRFVSPEKPLIYVTEVEEDDGN